MILSYSSDFSHHCVVRRRAAWARRAWQGRWRTCAGPHLQLECVKLHEGGGLGRVVLPVLVAAASKQLLEDGREARAVLEGDIHLGQLHRGAEPLALVSLRLQRVQRNLVQLTSPGSGVRCREGGRVRGQPRWREAAPWTEWWRPRSPRRETRCPARCKASEGEVGRPALEGGAHAWRWRRTS